ncbi:hypothetical protein CYLTODRAFT_421853 [Cylindrobasidium torrendii FP15055 ss-10]|uniref:Uncharacterized protein n=1 Tax=Cylindrobasidium torrendii FP15055 ss-10 TaxID=1314674 RepID=A0A0D7BDG6_9AGAR|nr:hypothetical protein CYLTODRAFT_421853 [Cylindrobasidium torrendii FP15055 ss-10]
MTARGRGPNTYAAEMAGRLFFPAFCSSHSSGGTAALPRLPTRVVYVDLDRPQWQRPSTKSSHLLLRLSTKHLIISPNDRTQRHQRRDTEYRLQLPTNLLLHQRTPNEPLSEVCAQYMAMFHLVSLRRVLPCT